MSAKKRADGAHVSSRIAAMAVSASAFAMFSPAYAQDQQPAQQPAADAAADEGEEIVVTGTILRGNASSINPIGVLSAEDMQARGQTTIADALQTLSGNAGGSLPNVSARSAAAK